MRHGRKINHLSRKTAHRKSMLGNMATSLIMHKRIFTTVAKAKALQKYVEPLITRSKTDSTHSRRMAFRYLKTKEAASELFREIAPKVVDRPGGYTRIIKTGPRLGDNADMCFIELVDFNELYTKESGTKKKKSRSRRGGAKKAAAAVTDTVEEVKDAAEDVAADATEAVKETKKAVKKKADDASKEEK